MYVKRHACKQEDFAKELDKFGKMSANMYNMSADNT